MKRFIILLILNLTLYTVQAQSAVNLSGLRFQQLQLDKSSYAILEFTSNRQVSYVMGGVLPMSGRSYRDVCPGTYTVTEGKILIRCVCADKEVFPDPLEDSFRYDASKKVLTSTRYQYTISSAPSADLSRKYIIWNQL
ncbi:MAG: hypothetical protein ACKO41_02445 [Sphingomonadales bacterium]